ncbi:F-type H+-transporting ATPase subunit a [Aeromicrobium panaciterrae]|uniref:ATP synthase subunit a n=1 Tax=Aeromicrobium panaciterrae TaxID=363861 RepID=A0ABU1UMP2_9ACTN|nr:F0F1 ATP synthase subunit A [Aeromicrobium panaciterrae]MDR7086428.1 F-type H+-transporting ATPase subunit a [Aeromicrobium panaciterrae]
MSLVAAGLATETEIEAGHHTTFEWLGLTFNSDTMLSTAVAGVVVLIFGFLLRRSVTDGVPGKIQLLWESLVEWVQGLTLSSIGRLNPFIVPLGVALFLFILIGNWFEAIPTGHKLPPPAADTNMTYGLALVVIIAVHTFGIREVGLRHYLKPFLSPLHLIEEIVKPFSLALRLFGNIFAGGIILSLIGLIPNYGAWIPEVLWKIFGMAIGGIQAFIFTLLTILYFGFAVSHGGDDEHHDEPKEKKKKKAKKAEEKVAVAA